jgi:circadian clock protein KaiC
VRELVLGKTGPELADVYTAGGEVLMGTLRWEKEDEERAKTVQLRTEFDQKRAELQVVEADTRTKIKTLQQDLERQRVVLATYSSNDEARIVSSSDREKEVRRIRSADPAGRTADATVAPLAKPHSTANGSGKSARKTRKEARGAP